MPSIPLVDDILRQFLGGLSSQICLSEAMSEVDTRRTSQGSRGYEQAK